jgi:hypothetical protein
MMRFSFSFYRPGSFPWPTEAPFRLEPPTHTLALFVRSAARLIFLPSTLIKTRFGSSNVSHSPYPNMLIGLDEYSLELARRAGAVYTNSKR